jgi:GrpB-like predicted nucleotidyltransferase (UPF0157 family)
MTKPLHEEIGLIGGREKRKIIIHDYDERWPKIFEKHAAIIRKALGGVALRIEHIGSTSVPCLAAKPIIDILVVAADPWDEASYLPALVDAGYELRVREPEFDEHRMVRTPERDIHVHIFPPQSNEIDRYLVFRNQLRLNPADRTRYEQVKRMLSEREWEDTNDYAEAKSEVVEAIIANGFRTFLKIR